MDVAIPEMPRRSYTWPVVCFVSGVSLIAISFPLADEADRRYAEYLRATDPARITDLYDDAVLLDRLSAGSILTGEVLIAAGLYLAFLRAPLPSRLDLVFEPSRCGVSLRF